MFHYTFSLILLSTICYTYSQYTADWESIDSRPLPPWYDRAKVGIFIHWGVYSVPAASNEWFGAEWFEWAYISGHNYPGDGGTPSDPPGPGSPKLIQFMNETYPGKTYQDLAADFTAENWNPDEWLQLFQRAGAKYVVLTTKHHDGFQLWPSNYSDPPNWNAGNNGPYRDLVGDLAKSTKSAGLRFGVYHSYCEWLHPLWLEDKRSGFASNNFVTQKTDPELYELVNNYEPDIIWSDGEWSHDWYWKAKEFLAWLYNDSPVKDSVVVNDRWAWDTTNAHGGFHSGMDRWNPGELQPHKWENCFTIDRYSWGYRNDNRPEDYMRAEEIIHTMIESVSCGGNVLINVAPMKDGTISQVEQERLFALGDWLQVNGDAIYNSIPHTVQTDFTTDGVWYTSNENGTIYAILTEWPGQTVHLGSIPFSECLIIGMLGGASSLEYSFANPGILVTLPAQEQINSKYAWTVTIEAARSTATPTTTTTTTTPTPSRITSESTTPIPSSVTGLSTTLSMTIGCLFINILFRKIKM